MWNSGSYIAYVNVACRILHYFVLTYRRSIGRQRSKMENYTLGNSTATMVNSTVDSNGTISSRDSSFFEDNLLLWILILPHVATLAFLCVVGESYFRSRMSGKRIKKMKRKRRLREVMDEFKWGEWTWARMLILTMRSCLGYAAMHDYKLFIFFLDVVIKWSVDFICAK